MSGSPERNNGGAPVAEVVEADEVLDPVDRAPATGNSALEGVDAAHRLIDSDLDLGLDTGVEADADAEAEPVVAAEAGRESWAARRARTLGERAVKMDELTEKPSSERLRTAASWVSERFKAARDALTERVGTWTEIKEYGKAVLKVGKSTVKLGAGLGADVAKAGGRKLQNAGSHVAAAHDTVVGAGHEVHGMVRNARAEAAARQRTNAEAFAAADRKLAGERRVAMGSEGVGFWKKVGHAIRESLHERAATKMDKSAAEWKALEDKRRAKATTSTGKAVGRYGQATAHTGNAAARRNGSGPAPTELGS